MSHTHSLLAALICAIALCSVVTGFHIIDNRKVKAALNSGICTSKFLISLMKHLEKEASNPHQAGSVREPLLPPADSAYGGSTACSASSTRNQFVHFFSRMFLSESAQLSQFDPTRSAKIQLEEKISGIKTEMQNLKQTFDWFREVTKTSQKSFIKWCNSNDIPDSFEPFKLIVTKALKKHMSWHDSWLERHNEFAKISVPENVQIDSVLDFASQYCRYILNIHEWYEQSTKIIHLPSIIQTDPFMFRQLLESLKTNSNSDPSNQDEVLKTFEFEMACLQSRDPDTAACELKLTDEVEIGGVESLERFVRKLEAIVSREYERVSV